jgi:transcriptional regulator with XRE-family HTH domain
MSATQKLIALAMERTGAKTQTELAVKTGLSKQMVSFYVSGRSAIQRPEHIAHICLLIGEDPQRWFAALAAEASDRTDVKSWARRLGAAAALVVALFPVGNAKASPIQVIDSHGEFASNAYYVKSAPRLAGLPF